MQLEFKILQMELLSETLKKVKKSATLKISCNEVTPEWISDLQNIIETNQGNFELNIHLFDFAEQFDLPMHSFKYRVDLTQQFKNSLEQLRNIDLVLN